MYCCKCDASIEEDGGSQMKGCYHFLCTNCLVEATNQTEVEGIVCAGSNGIYQCTGYLTHEELEHMVPDEIYGEYLERISELAAEEFPEDVEHEDESEPGAAAIPPKNRPRRSAHLEDLKLTDDERNYGWAQKACLIDNLMRFEGFSSAREAENFVDKMPLMESRSETACPICLEDKIPVGEGVVLKECLHMFCKDCLRNHIRVAETSAVTCPFAEEDFQCDEELKPKEILALVGEEEYRRHFENLSLREAAASIPNVFHCLTPDCLGFCVADQPGVTLFQCDICRARNCIQCKLIHPGTCAEFRQRIDDDENRKVQRQNDIMSENAIQQSLQNRVFMRCPKCQTVIQKNGGCAHMICLARGCGYDFNWTGQMM